MPIIESRALSLSVSSPSQCGRTIVHCNTDDITVELPCAMAVMPIELTNGCTESKCVVNSDNVHLTNFLRKHYLEHYGHRDLDGMMSDYDNTTLPLLIHNVTSYDNSKNGGLQEQHSKLKFHGQDEIRSYYQDHVFNTDDATSFTLESMTIQNMQATVNWSAKTPTLSIVEGIDRFVFNHKNGLIVKQYFSCETHERENMHHRRLSSSFSDSERSSDYSGFFDCSEE